ncbi:SDR family NAD(P)-dependent oxidoreductase [Arthrobacter bambusae]|uniref:NAD(P)-dependent dehydrogenase (Short-subunit alcohol dehydrogenase family) n=1 Tax=Arthrobacter bambusae TaxID=1338426 RepID=A0AAW8DCQ1_9MICC|nr:SDR family oxidoreductase [Arthrobacter bambusae]MDP9905480.1 NAD(P)-dependent dehydrogenase (short-subunit alcohol dehydrogenase family) [Arthrobacter bambusae]MDQ0127438.1 NAD(P)-dependent dehydrogenase (short-subunit alcohol dehydrogenase family) [Arthrobacter bambusae]MDQ0178780.1 NAD(P)-dependent dehydrogenase (short-subunit alcohol dehydrogenase family) [Arthrobacter bambusae]
MSLKDQVVLVTGSSGGIGDAAVSALKAAGAIVVGADRSPKEDQPLEAFYPLDITSEQQCAAAIQDIASKHGRIDVLIHAAGVLGPTPGIMETTTEEFDSILRINASATFTMVRETAKSMLESGTAGAIVVLSSVAAKEARLNYLRYNASKLAVLHIMWSFAELLGPNGISVNAIAPGPVNTPMWAQFAKDSGPDAAANRAKRAAQLPMRRFAEPDEVARAILFLADPDNRYITGVSLDVAGGAHLGIGT